MCGPEFAEGPAAPGIPEPTAAAFEAAITASSMLDSRGCHTNTVTTAAKTSASAGFPIPAFIAILPSLSAESLPSYPCGDAVLQGILIG
jgi:hypothetical protein